MTFSVITGALSADVANNGTITVSYPSGKNKGSFYLAMGHVFVLGSNAAQVLSFPSQFDITLNASDITVTNKSGSTWAAGTAWRLQMEEQGKRAYRDDATRQLMASMTSADTFLVNLGSPIAASATSICTAQAVVGAGYATLNGALVSNSIGVLDVPRNFQCVSSNAGDTTQTVTVRGKDVYGNSMTETTTLNGTTIKNGLKAFKQITSVYCSAALAGNLTLGHNDVLGLPVFMPSGGNILKELQDGATATAGTVVAGIRTAGGSTATTGDVRGTYDPNAAADGSRVFQLICAMPDPGNIGIAQYAG